jgi:hypothetical protein
MNVPAYPLLEKRKIKVLMQTGERRGRTGGRGEGGGVMPKAAIPGRKGEKLKSDAILTDRRDVPGKNDEPLLSLPDPALNVLQCKEKIF